MSFLRNSVLNFIRLRQAFHFIRLRNSVLNFIRLRQVFAFYYSDHHAYVTYCNWFSFNPIQEFGIKNACTKFLSDEVK